jgi:hypothetical protein
VCSSGSGGGTANTGGGTATGGSGNTGGGSATGGSGNTGGGAGMSCNIQSPTCGSNSVCLISSQDGMSATCFPGCDPAAQNCGAGQKCTYVSSGMTFARECVDAGTVAEGATCAQSASGDNCQAGLLCTSDNKCTKFCNASGVACTSGSSCSGFLILNNGEFPLICEPGCSLLAQDCMGNQGCYPSTGGSICATAGTADAGAACTHGNDCGKGALCAGPMGGATCLKMCNLDGGSPGCSGSTCSATMPALPQGAGVCP